ncbi:hypothetical protein LTS08_007920 [Lithohypha guttulata]|uniref:Potassium transport protein n=1 Tax=Lithohypha guttulata TaxID=1690604 RepID=A0AAN7PJS5_9EURO|nr:hypothetical protein LTR05_008501 [Lithohypha guttulata]KAK5095785.1 hypothetical protein LTS08_007920 [Lithohypha guttulata]
MWKPKLTFITLHYLYIIAIGILVLIILYPNGNISSTDAYFFGVSGSTESGLNPVDVNDLRLYQQLTIYFIPFLGNMQVVSIFIVIIRLIWFRRYLGVKLEKSQKHRASTVPIGNGISDVAVAKDKLIFPPQRSRSWAEGERAVDKQRSLSVNLAAPEKVNTDTSTQQYPESLITRALALAATEDIRKTRSHTPEGRSHAPVSPTHVTFAPGADNDPDSTFLPQRVQSSDEDLAPWDEKRGRAITFHEGRKLDLMRSRSSEGVDGSVRFRKRLGSLSDGPPDPKSLHRVVSNLFELGAGDVPGQRHNGVPLRRTSTSESSRSRSRARETNRRHSRAEKLKLSANAIIGRNSNFSNLTTEDQDRLGGIEYRSLKLLLKFVLGYVFGLHFIGAICLIPWIHLTPEPKYRRYLADCGLNSTWWAIYSAGTMANNLGFTLTPDSMISFRDAVFPILVMTILAYAGHTFYPVGLRILIWTFSKILPRNHKMQEPLHFLLEHPRRCYTLLFPARQTWILAGILIALNIVDVILIICLDLDNPEVTAVPLAPRFISSIFQAASSRHTGTLTYNLANVNPGVQFSLLVMMYVSIFPIALSVRSSNTYEETSLGIFQSDEEDPSKANDSKSYLKAHVRNQLSFDLWYIFLGCFCICCSEADKIMDTNDPAFQVFPVFFEVASAYGNVGLSLGHPSVTTSFSGKFNTFSKLVICAMMIRGRHRGLPVRLDRAILLPSDKFSINDIESRPRESRNISKRLPKLKLAHTQ